jgi:hypothetical protein
MTWRDWLDLWPVVLVVFNLIFGAAVFALTKTFVSKKDFADFQAVHDRDHDGLAERLARGEARFSHFDATLDAMPTKDELHMLGLQLAELRGDLKETRALLRNTQRDGDLLIRGHLEGEKG